MAKRWREYNPQLTSLGKLRDHDDLVLLSVLANLEILNSVMIKAGTVKDKRFELLRKNYRRAKGKSPEFIR